MTVALDKKRFGPWALVTGASYTLTIATRHATGRMVWVLARSAGLSSSPALQNPGSASTATA
jgi:hypothetical protein